MSAPTAQPTDDVAILKRQIETLWEEIEDLRAALRDKCDGYACASASDADLPDIERRLWRVEQRPWLCSCAACQASAGAR